MRARGQDRPPDEHRCTIAREPEALIAVASEWNALAVRSRSPFCTAEWLSAWWRAFGRGELVCLTLRDRGGPLRAGAVLMRTPHGRLEAAANDHSGSWDVVAADAAARAELWRALLAIGARQIVLRALPAEPTAGASAAELLAGAGYRVVDEPGPFSPFLGLPERFENLLAQRSANLRSQLGRKRRALEGNGALVFRTTTGGEALERDLEAIFRVEASGWKSDQGTSILTDPGSERLYREFAHAAARHGWLRLHLLELDGVTIAGDYACSFAGGGHLIKTGYDERWSRFSPGLLLREAVLRAAVEERLEFYDFLGGPEHYKLRWTDHERPRTTLRGYRGVRSLPALVYRARVRPTVKRLRSRLKPGPARRGPGRARR